MSDEETPSGFCSSCGEECTAILVDFGIGAYEYWGAPGVDVDNQWVSPCCEADLVDEQPEEEAEESFVNIGDRVRVTGQIWSHQNYPFLPDLVGKEGVVLDVTHFEGDSSVVKIKFDQKFKCATVPEGVHAFDYSPHPDEWEEVDEYSLTDEEVEVTSQTSGEIADS